MKGLLVHGGADSPIGSVGYSVSWDRDGIRASWVHIDIALDHRAAICALLSSFEEVAQS